MSLLHRLDMICMLAGWHRNPWSRRIDRLFWDDLAWRTAMWRAGLDPDAVYPELRGRL